MADARMISSVVEGHKAETERGHIPGCAKSACDGCDVGHMASKGRALVPITA